ncbi:MAG: DnaA regulatory inactivator Hda [Gammaproteobacteria bacterium]|nr:DnaA regulatory inactivator Hda [Gammaproteobacteria bacterium]
MSGGVATDRHGWNSVVMKQIPLSLRLRESATFENFVVGANAELVATLCGDDKSAPGMIYIWGGPATGRSHLLQAVCRRDSDTAAFYLPLADGIDFDPAILSGLAAFPDVCIDDVDPIAGQPEWERALFVLYNELREREGRLIVTARRPVQELDWRLPDLRSRLSWGVTYHLQPLDDDGKYEALLRRATNRGLDLPDEVAQYLMTHCARDLGALFAVFDDLDNSSLIYKRRLTIPFVRECLGRTKENDGAPGQEA